jgi:hypothetical protein
VLRWLFSTRPLRANNTAPHVGVRSAPARYAGLDSSEIGFFFESVGTMTSELLAVDSVSTDMLSKDERAKHEKFESSSVHHVERRSSRRGGSCGRQRVRESSSRTGLFNKRARDEAPRTTAEHLPKVSHTVAKRAHSPKEGSLGSAGPAPPRGSSGPPTRGESATAAAPPPPDADERDRPTPCRVRTRGAFGPSASAFAFWLVRLLGYVCVGVGSFSLRAIHTKIPGRFVCCIFFENICTLWSSRWI